MILLYATIRFDGYRNSRCSLMTINVNHIFFNNFQNSTQTQRTNIMAAHSLLSLLLVLLLSLAFAENIDCRGGGKCKCKTPGHCQILYVKCQIPLPIPQSTTTCTTNLNWFYPNSCDSVTQQCRGAKLRCLPGYDCTIYCLGFVPLHTTLPPIWYPNWFLWVNRDGACLDSAISGNDATHVDLICDGTGACGRGKYYCGSGDCTLQCANSDDCTDIRVLTTAKAHSWKCNGFRPSSLPAPITPAPTSTLNNNLIPGRPTKYVHSL